MGSVVGKRAFAVKQDGIVSVDFEPVVSVDVPDLKTVKLSFNRTSCDELGLDTALVQARFEAGGRKRAPIKWEPSP